MTADAAKVLKMVADAAVDAYMQGHDASFSPAKFALKLHEKINALSADTPQQTPKECEHSWEIKYGSFATTKTCILCGKRDRPTAIGDAEDKMNEREKNYWRDDGSAEQERLEIEAKRRIKEAQEKAARDSERPPSPEKSSTPSPSSSTQAAPRKYVKDGACDECDADCWENVGGLATCAKCGHKRFWNRRCSCGSEHIATLETRHAMDCIAWVPREPATLENTPEASGTARKAPSQSSDSVSASPQPPQGEAAPPTNIAPDKITRLKDCPFCGGDAMWREWFESPHIQCSQCGAVGPISTQHIVEEWNHREGRAPVAEAPTVPDFRAAAAEYEEQLPENCSIQEAGTRVRCFIAGALHGWGRHPSPPSAQQAQKGDE